MSIQSVEPVAALTMVMKKHAAFSFSIENEPVGKHTYRFKMATSKKWLGQILKP